MNKKKRRKRKRLTSFGRRLILIVVGIVLGINIYLINANTFLKNKLPMPFGYGIAIVMSGSMEPTLSKGDLILIKDTNSISNGDIIVYQSNSSLIVHRVISIDENTITTQGDANNVPDEPFDISYVKGVVKISIPNAGILVEIMQSPIGIILILISTFLLEEISLRKQKEKDDIDIEKIKEEIRKLKQDSK